MLMLYVTAPYIVGIVAGLASFILLNLAVQFMMTYLKQKGGLARELEREARVGISRYFARVEQFLFALVVLLGKDTFGVIAAAWLVLKAIHKWVRWDSTSSLIAEGPNSTKQETGDDTAMLNAKDEAIGVGRLNEEYIEAHRLSLTRGEYRAQLARNRFMIFVAGTGISIAAGGLSGSTYLYAQQNSQALAGC